MTFCYKCGYEWKAGTPSRIDVCSNCRSDVRVCLNCVFYLVTAANQCREIGIEPVMEKDKANFCDHFRFKELAAPLSSGPKKGDGKAEWDRLFKK
jgi:hypothetical protein